MVIGVYLNQTRDIGIGIFLGMTSGPFLGTAIGPT